MALDKINIGTRIRKVREEIYHETRQAFAERCGLSENNLGKLERGEILISSKALDKEVRDYHETIFFGLNTRQFICSLLAPGVAVGVYFLLRPLLGTEEIGWVCILAAVPFAACGFFSYHGMTAEQLFWAWFKSEILSPKRLVYRFNSYYYDAIQGGMRMKKPKQKKRSRKEKRH